MLTPYFGVAVQFDQFSCSKNIPYFFLWMWGWFLVTFFAAIFTPKQKKNCFGTSTSARPLLSNWQILLVLGKQERPVGIVINSMNNLFRPKFEQHSWIIMNILSTWIESVLTGFPDMSFFCKHMQILSKSCIFIWNACSGKRDRDCLSGYSGILEPAKEIQRKTFLMFG